MKGTVPSAQGWQPIETVPKDWGITHFDVWSRGERVADCWWGKATYGDGKTSGVVYQDSYDCNGPVNELVAEPTHWMPLPPAPGALAAASPEVLPASPVPNVQDPSSVSATSTDGGNHAHD